MPPPRLNPLRLSTTTSPLLLHPPPRPFASKHLLLPLPQHQHHQHRPASLLTALSDTKGAYQKRIRRGRGPASGKGKTAGRGQKGQHAHGKVKAGFEGGQTPLAIARPERGGGVWNRFKIDMSPINLDRIQAWIEQGRIDAGKVITMRELHKSRCLHGVKRHGVKLLGRNAEALTTPIHIIVSRASASAIARIESLGGSVTTRFYSPTSIKRVLRGDSHPAISAQAPAHLISRAAHPSLVPPALVDALQNATTTTTSPSTAVPAKAAATPVPTEARKEAISAILEQVGAKYKYRLPDATARKDIEYYRDPAHRGYLSYMVEEGQSPSLFFRKPGEGREDKSRSGVRGAKGKKGPDNRLF